MALVVVVAAIVTLVLLVAWAKVHPFLAFVIVSAAAGLLLGIAPERIPGVVRKGIGDVFGALGITIVAGAMLGRLVVESGAAARIAATLVAAFGERWLSWAMALTGFVVGIPLFYGVGFVLLVPIIFAIIGRHRLPPLVVALPALAAMSVAHGLLPPHPAPTALAEQFQADLGRTLLYGFLIAVPAIVLAGPVFARTLAGIEARPLPGLAAAPEPAGGGPGIVASVVAALLPVGVLMATAVAGAWLPAGSRPAAAVKLAGDPDCVMIASLAVAAVLLGTSRGRSLPDVMGIYAAAIGDVASILLVVAGAGAFKEVLVASGVNATIADALRGVPVHPLLLAWLVTAAIRIGVGSATVAGLTAAGILEPIVASGSVDPCLAVLAIGAGSLACSHVNDGAFWLFKEYFNVSLADTLRSWTVMETIVSVVGLAGVLVLSWLFPFAARG
jgi:Gnt-I system high-affinity gluconate transporter